MSKWLYEKLYNVEAFKKEGQTLFEGIENCRNIKSVRETLLRRIARLFRSPSRGEYPAAQELIRKRDCSLILHNVFSERSEAISGFNAVKAIWDITRGKAREDLKPGFYAEMINWIKGIEGRADFHFLFEQKKKTMISGREKAMARSDELDQIWKIVEKKMGSYADGLTEESQRFRKKQKERILKTIGATETDWQNWKWHIRNVVTDADTVRSLTYIEEEQCDLIQTARKEKLPFGITPYYLSLMENEPNMRDMAIRAQVFPPKDYVQHMAANRKNSNHSFDFMLESDTSPIDLITRRYPNVVILKPVMTCPQICVYCQRNWEIEQVMAPHSFAGEDEINKAIDWIRDHTAIREVLVTGGDPFILSDSKIESLLKRLSDIKHIDLIRFGSRVLVTLPMRITDRLADILGKFREPGKRDIAVMTHIEHPYEITNDTVMAVDRLKRQGISIYNQQVYTFYTSRRFESTLLRVILRRIGIDPYYTFMPKGKEETNSYRVPLARILQEQKEEARLVPGLRRTDAPVFNIPGLGKNYLLARQHRDLLTILPDGKRMYEFHPWDMNLISCETFLYSDISILDYLERLSMIGEDPSDYDSIWFFL
ncbi:MAG: KamA family radical SAM protein [Desulfobacula sp.]|nr:KamA family radical SAM protein [Desulfobacula sp.]